MKAALVTGAHGFLGRHVALELARHGYEVHGLGHGAWTDSEFGAWGMTNWMCGDVDVGALLSLEIAPELIIHCAGGSAVGAAEQHPAADFARTVVSTGAVLQAQARRWPRARLVLASSAAVYGKAAHLPLSEAAPLAPVSVYGMHKLLAEKAVQLYSDHYGLQASIVRLFSIYGPGLRKQLLWDACSRLTRGDAVFPGTGEETRDWLHVRDAASLLRIAGESDSARCLILNGGTGQRRRVDVVLGLIARTLAAGKTLSFTGQSRSGDPQHYEADIEIARALGWAPRENFEDAVAAYCAWFCREAAA
jgi:UDP-glucose 4-epimerase